MSIAQIGHEFTVSANYSGGNGITSIAALSDGNFFITWDNGDDIFGRFYDSSGTANGDEFAVNTSTTNYQVIPRVSVLSDGRLFETWQSADPGGAGDGSGFGIRATILNADGSPDTSVHNGKDFVVDTTTFDYQEDPRAVTLADGRVAVTWSSRDTGDGSGDCVRATVLNADGTPDNSVNSGNDFIVDTTTANNQIYPTIAPLTNGGFMEAWQSFTGTSYEVRGRIFGADGLPTGDDFRVDTTVSANTSNSYYPIPNMTQLVGGRIVVTWQDQLRDFDSDILARVFNADGTPDATVNGGNDFVVNTIVAFPQHAPAVAGLADGRFVIVWETPNVDVSAQIFNVDGTPDGTQFVVGGTSNYNLNPTAAGLSDGRFVVSWGDNTLGSVESAIFNPTVYHGTTADDTWTGGSFADRIFGAGGNDKLSGLGGADRIFGNAGKDHLSGGTGADSLNGGSGRDVLSGNGGRDVLNGGAGNDHLYGGNGHDIMTGGTGDDHLTGGAMTDTFIFSGDFGHDTITDFSANNHEKIDLSGISGITGFHNLVNHHLSTGPVADSVVIDDGSGHTIVLLGFTTDDFGAGHPISAADFIFS